MTKNCQAQTQTTRASITNIELEPPATTIEPTPAAIVASSSCLNCTGKWTSGKVPRFFFLIIFRVNEAGGIRLTGTRQTRKASASRSCKIKLTERPANQDQTGQGE